MNYEKEIKGFLVSKTNPKGKITYCNQAFIEVSGFSESELLGKPHSIVRHPDMPRTIFKFLWEEISKNREVNAFVKNRSKDGGYYWVFANITPSVDIVNQIVGYYSVRRKPNRAALKVIEDYYRSLKDIEQAQGLEAGLQYFYDFFAKQNQTYANAVLHLQLGEEQ